MKKLSLILMLLLLVLPSFAANIPKQDDGTFVQTLPLIQNALLNKDMPYLNQRIATEGIVKAKVDKILKKAESGSFFSKVGGFIAEMNRGNISKTISGLALHAYTGSSAAQRKYYLSRVKIKHVQEKDNQGTATGLFMGEGLVISGIKKGGKWIIVEIDSPLIDQEIKFALKSLRVF